MSIRLVPPYDRETATAKVQAQEFSWNFQDADAVARACTEDCEWRERDKFLTGRKAVADYLRAKWAIENDYRLRKEMWGYDDNRISVRFVYEWRHRDTAQWYRTHGNEHWEFDQKGLMSKRDSSANDIPITAEERQIAKG